MKPALDMKPETMEGYPGQMSMREDPAALLSARSGAPTVSPMGRRQDPQDDAHYLATQRSAGADPAGFPVDGDDYLGQSAGGAASPHSPTKRSGTMGGGVTRATMRSPQEVVVQRNGLVSTKHATYAIPFGAAKRTTIEPVGEAATVPMHYVPPGIESRDFNAEVKNSGFVPFATSVREAYYAKPVSSPMAGPGAYDVQKADPHLSTKTNRHGIPIPTGGREFGESKFKGPGPMDYHAEGDKYLAVTHLHKSVMVPFATSKRVEIVGKEGPAPHDTREAWEAMQGKHAYSYVFTTAPAHEKPLVADLSTADVPFYTADRSPRKINNTGSIGKAKRW